MARIFGVAEIRVDGSVLKSQPGATATIGGWISKSRNGHGHQGHSKAYEGGKLECEILLRAGTSLADLRDLEGATVVVACDTGQTYTSSSMEVTEPLSVTDGESSTVKVVLEGAHFEELKAQ